MGPAGRISVRHENHFAGWPPRALRSCHGPVRAHADAARAACARQNRLFFTPAAKKSTHRCPASPMIGQMYAGIFKIPQTLLHPYPIVMIHGGSQNPAPIFTGTPDGREGWAQYFSAPRLRRVCRRSSRARPRRLLDTGLRAGTSPELERTLQRFCCAGALTILWPQAHLQHPIGPVRQSG